MQHHHRSGVVLTVAVALALSLAAPAFADDDDLLASVYTENGYELRRDERVFALFTALNVAGFQRAEQVREQPFPRYVLHPIREKVRQALLTSADKLRPPVDLFLDTHPAPLDAYVTAALALGEEPTFTAGAGVPKELAGLDRMLAEFAQAAKLQKLSRGLASDYRAEFKRLREAVDGPFSKLRAAYRVKEEDGAPLVFIPNPFDAPSAAYARHAPDGTHVVVLGLPSGERAFDLQPALRAYSELLAREATTGASADALRDVVEQLKAQAIVPATFAPDELVRESLRAAVEKKLWAKDAEAEIEASFKAGLLLSREFLKALGEPDEAFPADKGSFAAQVVARVDVKKTAAELLKPAGKK